ncbi:hypothetical protein [uncultured Maribacter sp.]|uniref:hypothetical protein n=1 Tax=uncultured Maribacter sp. TaxID=431308 RepID=UPI00261E3CAE|nr:hypothetical protein [uncultured Maribacter sp.]
MDGSYENKFFGIDWELPTDCQYDDTLAQQWTKSSYPEMYPLAEKVYDMKQRIKMPPEQVKESIIFKLFKSQNQNSSIVLYAENISTIKGAQVSNLDDYMQQALKEAKENKQIALDSEDYESERIGGTKFYKLTGQIKVPNQVIVQHYYFTIINNFGLTVILSANDNAGIAKPEEKLETLSF